MGYLYFSLNTQIIELLYGGICVYNTILGEGGMGKGRCCMYVAKKGVCTSWWVLNQVTLTYKQTTCVHSIHASVGNTLPHRLVVQYPKIKTCTFMMLQRYLDQVHVKIYKYIYILR